MERSPELAGEFTAPADRKLVRTTEEEAAKKRSKNLRKEAEKLEGDPAYLQAKVAILGQELIELETRDEKHSRDREAELDAASALLGKKEYKEWMDPALPPPRRMELLVEEKRATLDAQALAHQLIAVGEADGDSGDAKTCALPPMLHDPPTDKPCGSACLSRARSARPRRRSRRTSARPRCLRSA